ncbi:MAG: hypothetical protein ABIU54_02535 [Candidatus Eisenbacteria bacterium]
MHARCALVLIALPLLGSCTPKPHVADWAVVQELTPAFLQKPGTTDPNLAVGEGGQVALTWVVRDTTGGADVWVAVSSDSGSAFGAPVRLNPKPGTVSSYIESRPVVAFAPSGKLVVVWAAKRDSGLYAADLVSRASTDGGRTFAPEAYLNSDHGDPLSTYHGFVALTFLADGRAVAAWIDGRGSPGLDEPMAGEIYASVSADGGGQWASDTRVASDVCACCRITLAAERSGHEPALLALAYRGMRGNLRDPRLATLRTDSLGVLSDTLVSADHWFLRGCPSVGPSITYERSGGGHYLWFTGESATDGTAPPKLTPPGVHLVAWRAESGATGPRRAMSDSLRDATRPVLADLGQATLIGVIGHPRADSARAVLAVRMLDPNGELGPWLFLGSGVRGAALAGAHPNLAYAAWVEKDKDEPRVRVARIGRRRR